MSTTKSVNRPRRWLLIFTALALFQFGAAYRALSLPADVSLLPPLEFAAGVIWGIIFAALGWQSAHRRWLRINVLALVAFIVYSVVRLTIFSRADYDRNRLPFLWVVMSIILIAAVVYELRLRRMQSTEKTYEP